MLSRNIVGIASITPRTLINVVLVLFVVSFGSVGCGDDSSPAAPSTTTPPTTPATPPTTPPAAPVTLTGLALFGPRAFVDSGTVEIGDTVQLNVDAEYSDDTTKRVTDEATWTSSNDHVATVVNGLVTARNVGGFNIRAEYEGLTIRSSGYRVERGYHFTIRNVSPNSIGSIEGTLENTGKDVSGEDWYIQAVLYVDGRDAHVAASEDNNYNDYMFNGSRKDFYIIPDTRTYDSYELRIVVGSDVAECAGCQRRRRRP